jgi:hypothetical protein
MAIEENDFQFVAKREKFVKSWPWVGGALVLLMLGYGGYLLFAQPLLINPLHAMEAIGAGQLKPELLTVMAAMLPEAVLMCFVLAGAFLAFSFSVMATERRYLRIIDALQADKKNASPSA